MFRKLRRRFLGSALFAVAAVLTLIVLCMGLSGYHMMTERLDQEIAITEAQYLASEKDVPSQMEVSDILKVGMPDRPIYWIAEYDDAGNRRFLSYAADARQKSITEEMSDRIIGFDDNEGFYDDYRYEKKKIHDGMRIICVDASVNLEQHRDSTKIMIQIALIGFGIFAAVLLYASRWMLRPYQVSWEVQKRFITNVSHDLKTPLTVVRADTDVLASKDPDNRWVNDIRLQADKMSKLVEEMVLLSRMQEPANHLNWVDFPISDIVEEEAQLFVQIAESRGIDFSFEVTPLLTCNGDARAIRHMTGVLLDNAVKYADEGGVVRLELRLRGSVIVLTVYNTVEHISREEIPHLTERFYRADRSRSTETDSHGIGLAFAEEVVRAHHGEITLSTEDEKSFLVTIKL